jgi:hypothetical protein
MKYLLLMYANEAETPDSAEAIQEIQKDWYAYLNEINGAGILLSNNGLLPASNATTVRVRAGKMLSVDGPFAETHEQLAGYSLVECKDLDEAVGWAARVPTAKYGSIEVRPVWSPPQ